MNNKIKYIHAFDPGLTTGYALFDVSTKTFLTRELTTIADHRSVFLKDQLFREDSMIVMEDFHMFEWKKDDLVNNGFPACRRIGIIEAFAYMYWTGKSIVMQPPSTKTTFPNPTLKRAFSLDKLPTSPHEKDAMRHATYYYFDKVVHG